MSLGALFLSLALVLWTCGTSHSETDHSQDQDAIHADHHHGEGKEYTSAYVCPMHCDGSGSDDPGKCPVCGMDYVEQAEHTKDGHSH